MFLRGCFAQLLFGHLLELPISRTSNVIFSFSVACEGSYACVHDLTLLQFVTLYFVSACGQFLCLSSGCIGPFKSAAMRQMMEMLLLPASDQALLLARAIRNFCSNVSML